MAAAVEPRAFLVAYDYGTGGLWAVVLAQSGDEITDRYPELVIADEPPAWMSDDRLAQLRAEPEDLDDPTTGIARAIPVVGARRTELQPSAAFFLAASTDSRRAAMRSMTGASASPSAAGSATMPSARASMASRNTSL